jgi:BolA family transcriptional regulator, general stress-responsive regulator
MNTDSMRTFPAETDLTTTVDVIRERLEILSPRTLEVYDDSHEHAGHAGAKERGGGHFQVILVSDRFEGKNQIARHRMIYQAVSDLMRDKIHALAIHAYTSSELADSNDGG